jgi:hypothetical protein
MARSQNSKVIFMPVEASSMLSSVGALKEMFNATEEKNEKLPPGSPQQQHRRELPK